MIFTEYQIKMNDRELSTWEKINNLSDNNNDYDSDTNDLLFIRNNERELALPHPTCCEQAKYIFAYRQHPKCIVDGIEYIDFDNFIDNGKPAWQLTLLTSFNNNYNKKQLIIKYCPFCATKLPDLKLKANPPQFVCIEDDFNCDRCEERYQGCYCDYPESMWEIVE
jgi:hypothetical protein